MIDVINEFFQLLYTMNDNIQRVSTGVLCELVAEKEGADCIEQEGAAGPLSQLAQSGNEAVGMSARLLPV